MTKKKWLSYGELVVIFVIVGIVVAILIPMVVKLGQGARRYACVENLKQLGLALNLYARENEGRYPPIDDRKNNFIFDANLLYPEYLNDQMLAVCPADPRWDPDTNFRLTADHPTDGTPKGQVHPDCFTDESYIYLGWMVMRDKEAEALFGAYDKFSADKYDADITVPEGWGNAEGDTIHRLSYSVDRFVITGEYFDSSMVSDRVAWAVVPIMWDRQYTDTAKFSHKPPGGHVLFMDNHVEDEILGGKFPPVAGYRMFSPMTETMARLLEERPRAPIPYCE